MRSWLPAVALFFVLAGAADALADGGGSRGKRQTNARRHKAPEPVTLAALGVGAALLVAARGAFGRKG